MISGPHCPREVKSGRPRNRRKRAWNTYAAHTKVIPPDLATGSALQQALFERRLAVDTYNHTSLHEHEYDTGWGVFTRARPSRTRREAKRKAGHTEGVDHAFLLPLHAVHAADPLAAVAQRSNTFNEMRALESRDKKVPCGKGKRGHA